MKKFIFSILTIVSVDTFAAEATQVYAFEMRFATLNEVVHNYIQRECETFRVNNPMVGYYGNSKENQHYNECKRTAEPKMRAENICNAQVKKDFEEGRPVPSICLWPAGSSSQFKTHKVAKTIDVDNSLIESLNSLAGNANSTENLKDLIRQVVQEEMKKQ